MTHTTRYLHGYNNLDDDFSIDAVATVDDLQTAIDNAYAALELEWEGTFTPSFNAIQIIAQSDALGGMTSLERVVCFDGFGSVIDREPDPRESIGLVLDQLEGQR